MNQAAASRRRHRQAADGGASVDRDRVAEAALSLIATGGIRSVTPSAVARHLRIPRERLSREYPDDAAIAAALFAYIEARLEEHVRSASSGAEDAIDRLERLITLSFDAIRGDSRLLSSALAIALSVGARGRQHRQRVLAILMSYLKDVTEIVRDGQRRGRIRPDVDAGTVALMYLGLIQPAAILSQVSDGAFDLRNHVQRSFTLFREAIEA
jgi:AcrR family transcriptional regulator